MLTEGIAIPFRWKLLSKTGNASSADHQACIESAIKLIGKNRIAGVLADREFASGKLFHWFHQQNIAFYIRIKENAQVLVGHKKLCRAQQLFTDVSVNTAKPLMMSIRIFQQKVYVAGARSERGELMIVATNQHPQSAISIYCRRWEIESLFQGLKTRGFRFEQTHRVAPERIEKLIALLAIAFCWAHKVGEWRAQRKPIAFNRYRKNRRPQYSYFRYGLDALREAILHWPFKKNLFKSYLT